ncbi:MAG: hypothetical protein JWM33_463 [Caulobacteraceae bacterium]|nr:hypothetical protein [Caulobacteraceae bacterium]
MKDDFSMPLKEFGLVLWQGRARPRRRGLFSFGLFPAVLAALSATAGVLLLIGARGAPSLGAMWALGAALLVPAVVMLLIPPLRTVLRWFAT